MSFLGRLAEFLGMGPARVDAVRLAAMAEFAGMISGDSAAFEAARQSAFEAGEDIPPWFAQVFLKDDRVAWGRAQEATRRKFEASISRHAISGAVSYVEGRSGNAYAEFLRRRLGPVASIGPSLALAGPTQAGIAGLPQRSDHREVLCWSGSINYDRFGMKQFSAIVRCDTDARKLLGQVSTALGKVVTPVSQGRAWRPLPGVIDSDLQPSAKAFEADGRYSVDNRPYVAREGDRLVIRDDVSGGRGRGGSGTVHLECIAVVPDRGNEALLVLRFSEGTTPMWLNRQSEALVARTLLGLADYLGAALKSPVFWKFRRGDWVHSQLLIVPGHGAFELLRAR